MRSFLFLLLLVATDTRAGTECTGPVQVVLSDPIATARAQDAIAEAIMGTAEQAPPGLRQLAQVVTFTLGVGLQNDAWTQTQTILESWMHGEGLPGAVTLAGVEDRQGWWIFDARDGTLEPTELRPGNDHFAGLFGPDQTYAINVRVDDPKKVVRYYRTRGLTRGLPGKQLKANVTVFSVMEPVLVEHGVSAFVHFGEEACR